MDSLTALRTAVIAGRVDAIKLQDGTVVIDGNSYPAMGETAFQSKSLKRRYKLLSLWIQYRARDVGYAEHLRMAKEAGIAVQDMVLLPEKKIVVDYLSGASTATDFVDPALLSAGAGGAAVDSSGSSSSGGAVAGSAVLADDTITLDVALRREIPLKTRASVLDVTSKVNLRDIVFARLIEIAAAAAGGSRKPLSSASSAGSAAGAGASSTSSASAAGSSASAAASAAMVGAKRPRPVGPGGSSAPGEDAMAHFRGTPIIIVPAAATSAITLHNAAAFLQDGRYLTPAEARAAAGSEPKPAKVTIRRRDGRGVLCQYHVIDNVALLQRADWMKVVAVFALGPEWQFKGWRWGRTDERPDVTPTEVFDRAVGFHLMWEGDAPHANIPKWNVKILAVSKTKRYLDAGVANKFWELVDRDVTVRKPYLMPKVAPGGAAGGGAAGSGTPGAAMGGAGTGAVAAGAGM